MSESVSKCAVCANTFERITEENQSFAPFCQRCNERYPDSLLKAHIDPFAYALKLRTGEIVMFDECRIDGNYAHLTLTPDSWRTSTERTVEYGYHRGIDVRIEDIVWCVDAPFGS